MATLFTLLVILAVFTLFAALADHEDAVKSLIARGIKFVTKAL